MYSDQFIVYFKFDFLIVSTSAPFPHRCRPVKDYAGADEWCCHGHACRYKQSFQGIKYMKKKIKSLAYGFFSGSCYICLRFFCFFFLGWMGGIGTNWPPVGAGECGGRSDEQGAGLWRNVQQRTAKWHLLMSSHSYLKPWIYNWIIAKVEQLPPLLVMPSLHSLTVHVLSH